MIEKSRVDDGVRLWLAAVRGAVVPVAVESDGVRKKDKAGVDFWAAPDEREVVERVRMATGIYIRTKRLAWAEDIGREVRKVTEYGRIVDGKDEWRKVTTASGEDVQVDGVGCDADRSRNGHHPFPDGIVAGCLPQIVVRAARFGLVDAPRGSGVWACHVPGKIALELPPPPDVSLLLVLDLLRSPFIVDAPTPDPAT